MGPLLVECFYDHPGQPTEVKKDAGGGGKKKGGGKTVSSFYKTQLDDLMKTLYATDPAFIRCVVPNTHKIPGGVEPAVVMAKKDKDAAGAVMKTIQLDPEKFRLGHTKV